MLALLNGSARQVAFEVALARWRARNAGVPEAHARRALVRLFTSTVWNTRDRRVPSLAMGAATGPG